MFNITFLNISLSIKKHSQAKGSLKIIKPHFQQAVACNRVRAFGHTPYLQSHKTRL